MAIKEVIQFIQITAAQGFLYALDSKGAIWVYAAMSEKKWVQLDLP